MIKLIGRSKKAELEVQRERLSFIIENFGGKPIEEINSIIPRSIIKEGQSYRYVLHDPAKGPNKISMDLIEIAKDKVINMIADGDEDIGLNMLEKTRSLASTQLQILGTEYNLGVSELIAHDIVGYGPISILMEDKSNIEEIEVNSPESTIDIYHAVYGRCHTNLKFKGYAEFIMTINRFAYACDKELNSINPILDAQLGDARLHAQMKPYAVNGASATIRIGGSKEVNLSRLYRSGTADSDMLAYLWLAMDSRMNIIIAGAPASGKTTLLNSILAFTQRTKRIITIEEDVNEFRFNSNVINIVPLYGSRLGKISTRSQVINAMRMRPEILVIGEIRDNETNELFSAAGIGVQFLTTMHSNDADMAILKKLTLKPMEVDSRALSMLDICVFMSQNIEGKRHIEKISEYAWLSRAESEPNQNVMESGDSVEIQNVINDGKFDKKLFMLSKVISKYSDLFGLTKQNALKEFERRSSFLSKQLSTESSTLDIINAIYNY
jgi:type IV secretory pathway ATPase VirB11/archaellum biosynthesis ATPase